MGSVSRTYLVDDLDGSTEDVSTVLFSLDKKDFEIDLSAANEARLREKLERFVEAGTEVKPKRVTDKPNPHRGGKAAKSAPVGREQTQAIREWARNNGLQVSERGRISAAIQDAFEAAH